MMATRRNPPRPKRLRLLEALPPDDPPRRLSRAGLLVVTAIVGFALAFVVLSW